MRREGNACRLDSLVRPAPLPEHLPLPQESTIEDVTGSERDKETGTEEQKDETQGEQDTGMSRFPIAIRLVKLIRSSQFYEFPF